VPRAAAEDASTRTAALCQRQRFGDLERELNGICGPRGRA
jgi:hypothetical protein